MKGKIFFLISLIVFLTGVLIERNSVLWIGCFGIGYFLEDITKQL